MVCDGLLISLSERTAEQTHLSTLLTVLLRKSSYSVSWDSLSSSHDLSLANHISKLVFKASHRRGILHHSKSFLGTRELISTDKASIRSLMEYCSPLWAGSLASHLAQIDAAETKALKIIVISCDEAVSGPITSPSQTGRWSLCLLPPPFWSCAFCMLCPPGICRMHAVYQQSHFRETT